MRDQATFRGCLLGGAVGDALGATVEFLSLADIHEKFGPAGIQELESGQITDDTQMTLFTAEGLLRADTRWNAKGICHVPTMLHFAYLRWLKTQGFRSRFPHAPDLDGWLYGVGALHARRAPGRTCVSALEAERFGTIDAPLNASKGCGGVMRVAPIGLTAGDPFALAMEAAALTHGHPTGYIAAGAFALMIGQIVQGATIADAVDAALDRLARQPGAEETIAALRDARAATSLDGLGQGWVAEEALAIAVFCALAARGDFAAGVRLAVNHSGDSDSTGAIAGNLLGASLGVDAIPARWLEKLELRAEITMVADDLLTGWRDDPDWAERYPGY